MHPTRGGDSDNAPAFWKFGNVRVAGLFNFKYVIRPLEIFYGNKKP